MICIVLQPSRSIWALIFIWRILITFITFFVTGSLGLNESISDLLTKSGMLGSRPINTPMDPVVQFNKNLGDALENPGRYSRLIWSLSTWQLLYKISHLLLEYWVGVYILLISFIGMLLYLTISKGTHGRGLFYRPSSYLHVASYSTGWWPYWS